MNSSEINMFQDEIVEEIHRIRKEYAESFNYNLDAIFADLQKQQLESDREVVKLPLKQSIRKHESSKK